MSPSALSWAAMLYARHFAGLCGGPSIVVVANNELDRLFPFTFIILPLSSLR